MGAGTAGEFACTDDFGVHGLGQAQACERGQGLRGPRAGEELEERFGMTVRAVALVEMGAQDVAVVALCVELEPPVAARRAAWGW